MRACDKKNSGIGPATKTLVGGPEGGRERERSIR